MLFSRLIAYGRPSRRRAAGGLALPAALLGGPGDLDYELLDELESAGGVFVGEEMVEPVPPSVGGGRSLFTEFIAPTQRLTEAPTVTVRSGETIGARGEREPSTILRAYQPIRDPWTGPVGA